MARRSSSRLPRDLCHSASIETLHSPMPHHLPPPTADHPYPQRRKIDPSRRNPTPTATHVVAVCHGDDYRPFSAVCAIIWALNALLLPPPACTGGDQGLSSTRTRQWRTRDLGPAAPRPPMNPTTGLKRRLRAARVRRQTPNVGRHAQVLLELVNGPRGGRPWRRRRLPPAPRLSAAPHAADLDGQRSFGSNSNFSQRIGIGGVTAPAPGARGRGECGACWFVQDWPFLSAATIRSFHYKKIVPAGRGAANTEPSFCRKGIKRSQTPTNTTSYQFNGGERVHGAI